MDTERQEINSIEWLGEWVMAIKSGNTVTATTTAETYETGGDITIDGKEYEVKVIAYPGWHFDPTKDRGDATKVTGGFCTYLNDHKAYWSNTLQKWVTSKMAKFRNGKLDGIFIIAPTIKKIAFFTTADLLQETDSNGKYAKLHKNVKTKDGGNLPLFWQQKALVNCNHATKIFKTENGDIKWDELKWMSGK